MFQQPTVGRLRNKLYDKRDDFSLPIVNFTFICSNIPAAPAFGVYISQLIRYYRACGAWHDFHDRGLMLPRKLLNQRSPVVKLPSSLYPVIPSFMTYHRVCNKSQTTGATCGAGAVYNSRALGFTPGFQRGSRCSIFSMFSM